MAFCYRVGGMKYWKNSYKQFAEKITENVFKIYQQNYKKKSNKKKTPEKC